MEVVKVVEVVGGGLRFKKMGNNYTCKFCSQNFLTKKQELKHLRKKKFNLAEISGNLQNLMKKEADSITSCFCGFQHKFASRVLEHVKKHLEEKQFQCKICLYKLSTKAALYKHRKKHAM